MGGLSLSLYPPLLSLSLSTPLSGRPLFPTLLISTQLTTHNKPSHSPDNRQVFSCAVPRPTRVLYPSHLSTVLVEHFPLCEGAPGLANQISGGSKCPHNPQTVLSTAPPPRFPPQKKSYGYIRICSCSSRHLDQSSVRLKWVNLRTL